MNTIILAAGRTDYRNMVQGPTTSQLLTFVNGRPAIAWVISDLLKRTPDHITIVADAFDTEMLDFCCTRYARHDRVHLCQVHNSCSILHLLMTGVNALPEPAVERPLRLNLGDTLLHNVPYGAADTVYVADFSVSSQNWCVVPVDASDRITRYYNKQPGLRSPDFKAVVGRYEFSRSDILKTALEATIREGKRELSDLLEKYALEQPLVARVISEAEWIDFGHLDGQARARGYLIESRPFNKLSINPELPEITKTSRQKEKIEREIHWYRTLPHALQSITPRILDYCNGPEQCSLKIEYYGYGTLAEKLLYLDLSDSFWKSTLTRLLQMVELFKQHTGEVAEAEVCPRGIYREKTSARLAQLRGQNNLWNDLLERAEIRINDRIYLGLPRLSAFMEENVERLVQSAEISIIHGDLCFNNILYDISSGAVKLIDPRGEFGGNVRTIYGDPRYDIAKLRHSYCGNYDSIIEGDFDLTHHGDGTFSFLVHKGRQQEREAIFDQVVRNFGYQPDQLRFIEALLFLSMIPLHTDSLRKQLAFFVTAIRKLNADITIDDRAIRF